MEHSREWVKATLVYGQAGKIESCIKMVKTIFPEQVSHIQETQFFSHQARSLGN